MTPTADALLAQLTAAQRPARAALGEVEYRSAMRWWGIPVPELRALAKSAVADLRETEPAAVLRLADQLLALNVMDARNLAYEIVALHKPTLASLDPTALERLGTGNDNWATTDTFACLIAGIIWNRRQISDAAVVQWAQSNNLWWRRTALAMTTMLNKKSRGGHGDPARTLLICECCAAEKELMVNKALSWALRSLVPWDRAGVDNFLTRHEAHLAALVKREVQTKLRTGKKNG